MIEPAQNKIMQLPAVIEPAQNKILQLPAVIKPAQNETLQLPAVIETAQDETLQLPAVIRPTMDDSLQLPAIVDRIPAIIEGTATEVVEDPEPVKEPPKTDAFAGIKKALSDALSFKNVVNVLGLSEQVGNIKKEFLDPIQGMARGAFDPIKDKLIELAESPVFKTFVENIGCAFGLIADIILFIIDLVCQIGGFFMNNWSVIAPIIYGIIAVLALMALITGINTIVTWVQVAATWAQTAAQNGLNAALLACPLVWIILLIIAIVAVIFLVVAAINHFAGTSISATGVIAGAFLWLMALIGNIVIGAINSIIQFFWTLFVEPFIGIIEFILNVANGGFNGLGGAVANLIGQIISWFLSMGKVVTKIIDAIFGTNWTAGLETLQDKVLSWGKNDTAITLNRDAPEINHRFDMTAAWDTGNEAGTNLEDGIKNFDLGDYAVNPIKANETTKNNNSVNNYFGDTSLYNGIQNNNSNMYSNMENTNTTYNNTGSLDSANTTYSNVGGSDSTYTNAATDISNDTSVSATDEQLVYMRDLAEQEAVNRFTTADIKVDMPVNANVSSNMDLDGIVNYLATGLNDAMEQAAEGVHA